MTKLVFGVADISARPTPVLDDRKLHYWTCRRDESTIGVVVSTVCTLIMLFILPILPSPMHIKCSRRTDCEHTECGHSANDCPGAVDPSVVPTGSTTTSATTCDVDIDACIADSDCNACYDAFWGSVDCGYEEFFHDYSYGYDTPVCKEHLDNLCCAVEAAEEVTGCATNDLWLALYGG